MSSEALKHLFPPPYYQGLQAFPRDCRDCRLFGFKATSELDTGGGEEGTLQCHTARCFAEIQLFFLSKCCPVFCKPLVSFQNSGKVASDDFRRLYFYGGEYFPEVLAPSFSLMAPPLVLIPSVCLEPTQPRAQGRPAQAGESWAQMRYGVGWCFRDRGGQGAGSAVAMRPGRLLPGRPARGLPACRVLRGWGPRSNARLSEVCCTGRPSGVPLS